MNDWPSPVPIVAASAKNATLTSIDGQTYDDFCLGDTASLFGHSPPALAAALAKQASEGLSYMLPTERGAALSERLGGDVRPAVMAGHDDRERSQSRRHPLVPRDQRAARKS